MRVALFATCLGDHLFADAVSSSASVLRHLGVDVTVPAGLTCCGQPAWNSGYAPAAVRMAAHTVQRLSGHDAVVLPSGSCAAMLRITYPRLLQGTRWEALAGELATRTWDLTAFIVDRLGVTELGSGLAGRRVAYHHGCHALRELAIRTPPLVLLEGAGAAIVEWVAAEECCGFGGTFSVKLPHVSVGMADRKLDTLPVCDVLTSMDGGCLMQLGGRAKKRGVAVRVRHLGSLLLEAIGGPS